MLLLQIEGSNHVQAVRMDDPSPGYAATYVRAVLRYIDPAATLLWCEVDVSSVADYGPDEIAFMLSGREDYVTDLPQEWQRAKRGEG